MVYNRTVTRFIADDKVVYYCVRREMQLASDTSWARLLEHLSWRSRWIITCTLEWRMAVSCEISRADRCLFSCPPDWARGPPLLRNKRGLPLPDCQTIIPVLRTLFSRLLMLPSFRPLPCCASHSTAFVHHTALTDKDF